MISVVIPCLNGEETLPETLAALVPAVVEGVIQEVILVDGGSADATKALGENAGCRVLDAPRGRGVQMRAGAEAAKGAWLLFLHADTVLSDAWWQAARDHMTIHPEQAAYFKLKFRASGLKPRWLAAMVQLRCLVLALPFGDQALLISQNLYEQVGGHPAWPLMEDVAIVRALGRRRLCALPALAQTSAVRYEKEGYARRIGKNLDCLLRFALGQSPESLARRYRGKVEP